MKKEDFLVELEDILQREEPCLENDLLESYEEWDSLAKMAILAFYSKHFSVGLNVAQLHELKTVKDLIDLSDGNIID